MRLLLRTAGIWIRTALAVVVCGAGDAYAAGERISLAWDANTESDLSYYSVYRAASEDGPYAKVSTSHITTTSYTDYGLAHSTTYWYVITATDTAGNESAYSVAISATTYSDQPEITFSNLSPTNLTSQTSPVAFSGKVASPHGIESVALWGDWSGAWKQESATPYDALSTETLKNPGFETFVDGLAADWQVSSGSGTVYAVAADSGNTGQAQRFTLSTVGVWGIYLYQTPSLQAGATYKWKLWYKTSGNASIVAEVCNASLTQIAFQHALPGTNGEWKRAELSFTYNNTHANLVRVSTNAAHTVWLDDCSLRAVDSAGTFPTEVYPSFSVVMGDGAHKWALRAANAYGSAATTSQTLEVPDVTAPATPTGLAATAGDKQAALDWNNNAESDVAHYDVYRATVQGGPYSKVNATAITTSEYTDMGLTNGTRYYYRVRAVDTSDNASDYSGEVSVTPADTAPPAAPMGLVAQTGNKQVTLQWDDNSEPDFNHYDLFRATTHGGPYTKINALALVAPTFVDTGLTNGTAYYYVVKAFDNIGNASAYSGEATATPTDTTPPAAPKNIMALAGDQQVALSWTTNTETDLDHYDVYRAATVGGPYTKTNATPLTSPSYTDTSLANGTVYYYVIRAVDKAGNESGNSAEAAAMPHDTTPPAPPSNPKGKPLS
jgi:fibronectin type 3 domain-containing protein